jgi:hypothetical protein
MQCVRCHSPDNQKEVFVLFATSIRILRSSLKKLESKFLRADVSLDTTTYESGPDISNTNVLVGSFMLTGETKTEVIAVVIRRAVRIVSSALLHLRGHVSMNNQRLNTSTDNGAPEPPKLL